MPRLFFTPQAVRVNSSGTPYAGAKANFYLTGTTTQTNTYSDSALSSAHANPVVADAGGQFAAIYLDPAITYRCIITDSSDVQLDDIDPVHVPIAGSDIAITDSGGYFTTDNVEAALQQLAADYLAKAGGTMTGALTMSGANINMADNVLSRPAITDYGITHNAITSTSNAITADCATGNSFYHLLTENTTFTLDNPPASGTFGQINIIIQQDGAGGAYTVTWPASVDWPSGTAPTISTANDAVDVITLFTVDGGTIWYGNFSQVYS